MRHYVPEVNHTEGADLVDATGHRGDTGDAETKGKGQRARDSGKVTPEAGVDDSDEGIAGGDKGESATVSKARAALSTGCGDASERALTSDGPTPELMCAVRVATANDTEIILLAKQLDDFNIITQRHNKSKNSKKRRRTQQNPNTYEGTTVETDRRTAGDLLRKAVSQESEARALAALHETVAALLDSYPTSDAEDEASLLATAVGGSPSMLSPPPSPGGGSAAPTAASDKSGGGGEGSAKGENPNLSTLNITVNKPFPIYPKY
jgi:hypothetical protein